ncbi:hypothetical protein K488DRAFT_85319 [Vararia minispora EC-137]|uniref:Uncharacterized protein n=1 Tax=Vararia minispora EC-137 TaxID=1314806 RepID=A0ACB8QMT3_9AGAM|nr:hypothetical protein K488DRAFT_85319 [Vararia minispora EC-137]
MASRLVWLITGTSSGVGRELTLAALRRGDRVVATARARSLGALDSLKAQGADVLELDVTAPLPDLQTIAEKAIALHGRVDVVVNNAGYIEIGAIEENTPEETQRQFDTNVFGALNVARAFLPHMRARKSGTILWLGSLGGWRTGSGLGLYAATKHALRALAGALDSEVSPLGLRSIVVELGYFRTSFLTASNRAPYRARITEYAPVVEAADKALLAMNGKQRGDPVKAAEIIVDVAHRSGVVEGKEIPYVIGLGEDYQTLVRGMAQDALKRVAEWDEIATSTDISKDA